MAGVLGLDGPDVDAALERGRDTGSARHVDGFRLQPGHRVVFTGQMLLGREVGVDRAEQAGLVVLPSVTKKVDLLVAADCDSLSGKARKAASYGVPVVDEATFHWWWSALSSAAVPHHS